MIFEVFYTFDIQPTSDEVDLIEREHEEYHRRLLQEQQNHEEEEEQPRHRSRSSSSRNDKSTIDNDMRCSSSTSV